MGMPLLVACFMRIKIFLSLSLSLSLCVCVCVCLSPSMHIDRSEIIARFRLFPPPLTKRCKKNICQVSLLATTLLVANTTDLFANIGCLNSVSAVVARVYR